MSRTELAVKSPAFHSVDFTIGGLQTDTHQTDHAGYHDRILSNYSPAQLELKTKPHRLKFTRRDKSPSGFMQIAPQDRVFASVEGSVSASKGGRNVVTTLLFNQNQVQSYRIEKSPGAIKTLKSFPKVRNLYDSNRQQGKIYKLSPLCAKGNSHISEDRVSPTLSVNLYPNRDSEIPYFRGRLSHYLSKENVEIKPRPHFLTPDQSTMSRKQTLRNPVRVTAFKRHSRVLPISSKKRIQLLDLEKGLNDDEDHIILGPWCGCKR